MKFRRRLKLFRIAIAPNAERLTVPRLRLMPAPRGRRFRFRVASRRSSVFNRRPASRGSSVLTAGLRCFGLMRTARLRIGFRLQLAHLIRRFGRRNSGIRVYRRRHCGSRLRIAGRRSSDDFRYVVINRRKENGHLEGARFLMHRFLPTAVRDAVLIDVALSLLTYGIGVPTFILALVGP